MPHSKFCLLILVLVPSFAQATTQHGLSLELGVGYSQFSLLAPTQAGKYSGVAAQGRALFPLLSSGQFSMDLDLSFQYTSLENNASNDQLSEWAHLDNFGTGLRLNYSYLFVGVDYLFARAQHVRAGNSNQIFEYDYNPIQWQAGLALPVSPVTSIIASYSQQLESDIETGGSTFKASDQTFWIRFQIDFGVSFFNLLSPQESFRSTRGGFFVRGSGAGR